MKSFSLKENLCTKTWYLIDCKNAILGRLSSEVARILQNKHLASYTPNMRMYGSYVVLINSDSIAVTGKKLQQKKYYRHTGYIGHLKEKTLDTRMKEDSREVIKDAIYNMLPRSKSRKHMLRKLRIYKSNQHNHQGQNPENVTEKVVTKLLENNK